ncbi:Acetamidase Formamidase [Lecanosticta acicola]|uniref:Acetamidase Formamidase n=1 Tax=Lecanosticta acicola TaxID=111012 RepID=A0AAI8YYQ4_9PEZI|nr:Acetamidase Formamidase [Lecanosticta acicola]
MSAHQPTSASSIREIRTVVSLDPHGAPLSQKGVHTRWHPEIPAVACVKPGEPFKVECMDFTGNSVSRSDSADDILEICWERDHHLSGPIRVEEAKPGDVLCVDILEVQPFPDRLWGFSLIDPGLGPLDRPHTRVAKTIWDFEGVLASSRHIKDVAFCGRPHSGVIGTAPSAELLQRWAEREGDLNQRYSCHGVTCAQMPTEEGAYVGQDLPADVLQKIKSEGARTKPAREHGGNIDSASLTRGSRIFLPVYVDGANLSTGDLHFFQGDGEPTCAIEMAGIVTMKCSILPRGMEELGFKCPVVIPSPAEPLYRQQVEFHGLSIDAAGNQHRSGLTTAYVQAASNAMEYLEKFGYSHEQAYTLLATAPIESRILAVPNIPTANVSVGVPLHIFDFDIQPTASEPSARDRGSVAYLGKERERRFLAERKPKRSPFERPQ